MGLPDDASLQFSTPERLSLDLPIAGVGSRALAWMVDAAILGFAWVVLLFVVTLLVPDPGGALGGLSGLGRSLLVLGAFAAQWVYWTACEVLWKGQTPGKRVARIRVARLDGSAPGPLESAVRNLVRVIDFLPVGYALGITTSLLDGRHRRLGDLAAGTVLLRAERLSLDSLVAARPLRAIPVTGGTAGAHHGLDPELAGLLASFLIRRDALLPQARERIARLLFERIVEARPEALTEDERAALATNPRGIEAWLTSRMGQGDPTGPA